MPSAQSTPARSSNNVPAARSGTSTGPAKRNAAPPSNIQVPGGTKQQMQFPKKSKYSTTPGASSGQFRAGNKPAPKPNARAASDSAAKARAADMAKLSPAIRDLHIRQPYCPAGGSNVQVGQDGLPRLNAPVQTGSSLMPHHPNPNQIVVGSGVQASGSGAGAMRTIGGNVASTMTSQGWDGAAMRGGVLLLGVGAAVAIHSRKSRARAGNASSNGSLADIGGMTTPRGLSASGSSAW